MEVVVVVLREVVWEPPCGAGHLKERLPPGLGRGGAAATQQLAHIRVALWSSYRSVLADCSNALQKGREPGTVRRI